MVKKADETLAVVVVEEEEEEAGMEPGVDVAPVV
jgi:hypothetical protein